MSQNLGTYHVLKTTFAQVTLTHRQLNSDKFFITKLFNKPKLQMISLKTSIFLQIGSFLITSDFNIL